MKMKAVKTFVIGCVVLLISLIQLAADFSPAKLIGVGLGIFFAIWGWKIGWTRHRTLTVLVGHIAVTAGCLVIAWSIYRLPFLESAPTILEVLNMPLFWGLFTLFGGYCMITHSYCKCAIRMHEKNNRLDSSKDARIGYETILESGRSEAECIR